MGTGIAQYIPLFGAKVAVDNFRETKRENSVFEARSFGEWGRGVYNYARYGVICAENLVIIGGLSCLCSGVAN